MNELLKLATMLTTRNIHYVINDCWGGYQIKCDTWDAVWHPYSEGYSSGLLEIYGSIVEAGPGEIEGFLTAEKIIAKL